MAAACRSSPRRAAAARGPSSRSPTPVPAFHGRARAACSSPSSPRRKPGAASVSISPTESSRSTAALSTRVPDRAAERCSRSRFPRWRRPAMSAPAEPQGRGILPALPAAAARVALSPPRVPASVLPDITRARAAGALAVPVRLDVPVAGGRPLLARALHADSGRTGPLLVTDGRCDGLHDLPEGSSVLVHVETLTLPASGVLESLIDDGATWVLVAGPPGDALPAALSSRLGAAAVRIAPLGDRLDDLPDLARH